ncbi:Transposon Tf2-8 polyprotein [Trichoplax sp. H2]|nr:Transposon Tf2-8 polyprotein [Trichoplax sp. H2]|eukprot:RDD39106.1 Transposon Tf2-8 polyprotein [Trichoplax sp. H2]
MDIDDKVRWTKDCEQAFLELKQCLTKEPILRAVNEDQPFSVQIDASDLGIGAVLMQVYDNTEHPVAYASRK